MSSNTLEASLIKIFNEAQNGIQFHKKELKALETVSHEWEGSFPEFFDTLFELVQRLLVILKREPATERLVEFLARFAVSTAPRTSRVNAGDKEDGDDSSSIEEELDEDKILGNFTHLLFVRLLEYYQAKERAVRFRVAQIIAKTLNYARNDPAIRIHSSILDDISEALLTLLYDRYSLVRTQAALALSFFQDPGDSECQITSALAWSMENDSSAEVRRCIVLNIVLTPTTLGLVIGRTRDISEVIRRCTFLVLADKCTIRHLKIEQRIRLLRDGLQDRSEQVREACLQGLLRSWCLTLDGDINNLLRRLDLESSTDICEKVLVSLFRDLEDEELVKLFKDLLVVPNGNGTSEEESSSEESPHSCTIPIENLEPEAAFFWRCLCKYFKTQYDASKDPSDLQNLEQVTPTLSDFCEYLKSCFSSVNLVPDSQESQSCDSLMTREFTMAEVCGIIPFLDFTDEVGRRNISQLIYSLITGGQVPAGLVSPLLAEQVTIWPQESFRVEKMLEIIADIRYPGFSESTITANSENSLCNLSYLDLKEDTHSLLKCLSIATELFGQLKLGKMSPSLKTLVESLLFPCIKNENPYIRDMAVNALGRACLVDLELARDHILLFIQVSTVDHETVQATALKVVFDLLHMYGLEAFSHEEEGGGSKGTEEKGGSEEADAEIRSEEGELAYDDPRKPSNSQGEEEAKTTDDGDEGTGGGETAASQMTQKFLHILANFLDGESFLLRGVAVEGLSKLLLSGRVISVKLLVRLFLMWYNPTVQDDSHIRSVLGDFFTRYAACGQDCREIIAECYLPLMKTVFEAPSTSPISEIDVNNMTSFVLSISAPGEEEEDSSHDSLSLTVANLLLSNDEMVCDKKWCQTLCRGMSQMTYTSTNKSNAKDMLTLLDQLCEVITDRSSLKYLEKLKTSLLKIAPNTETDPVNSTESGGNALTNDDPIEEEGSVIDSDKENIESGPCTPTSASSHNTTLLSVPAIKSNMGNKNVGSGNRRNKTLSSGRRPITRKITKKRSNTLEVKTDEGDEDSDDSLVGEHSPFVQATRSRHRV